MKIIVFIFFPKILFGWYVSKNHATWKLERGGSCRDPWEGSSSSRNAPMITLGHLGSATVPRFVNFVRVTYILLRFSTWFFFLSCERESGTQEDGWLQPMRAMIHPLWASAVVRWPICLDEESVHEERASIRVDNVFPMSSIFAIVLVL